MERIDVSPKSRLVALLFCIFLGLFGIHRFYLRKIWTGILMVVTFGGFGIWVLADFILIAVGSFRDKEGRRVVKWLEEEALRSHEKSVVAVSPYSRLVALLFCIFLGLFGGHRFYVGKTGTAVLMICTLGGFGFWILFDFILIALGAFQDKKGRRVIMWLEEGSF